MSTSENDRAERRWTREAIAPQPTKPSRSLCVTGRTTVDAAPAGGEPPRCCRCRARSRAPHRRTGPQPSRPLPRACPRRRLSSLLHPSDATIRFVITNGASGNAAAWTSRRGRLQWAERLRSPEAAAERPVEQDAAERGDVDVVEDSVRHVAHLAAVRRGGARRGRRRRRDRTAREATSARASRRKHPLWSATSVSGRGVVPVYAP